MQHGKARPGKPSTAKQMRTPATGPSPLSAEPVSEGKGCPRISADIPTDKSTPAGPLPDTAPTVPHTMPATVKQTAAKADTPLGESAVGRRVQVYWDGEKAW